MRLLMTGSHGFVGSNLFEALSGEHEIIRWDVRANGLLPDCDAVIHLAGKAHDTTNTTHEDEYFKVNTELTKKMYNAFLMSKAKKFFFFSSIKAQDNDTPYARSKKAAEDSILANTDSTNASNKSFYILRPCMIHGKGVKGNLPLLFQFVKKGWPWPLAAFENQRSYTLMGNVSYVVKELLKKDVASGIYNLCDDECISTNDLIKLMNESLGRKPRMLCIPKSLIRIGAKMGDILKLPLNTERLRKLTAEFVVDNSEIKHALGINHMPIRAVDGFKYTLQGMMEK